MFPALRHAQLDRVYESMHNDQSCMSMYLLRLCTSSVCDCQNTTLEVIRVPDLVVERQVIVAVKACHWRAGYHMGGVQIESHDRVLMVYYTEGYHVSELMYCERLGTSNVIHGHQHLYDFHHIQ